MIATIGQNTNAKTAIQLIGALGRGAFISNSTPRTSEGIKETLIHVKNRD